MTRKLIDINFLSIFFVEDHPGFSYIKKLMDEGLTGAFKIIIPEILPFRAFWILTTKWGIDKQLAKEIIFEFVKNYSIPIYAGLKRDTIIEAFKYSNELNHDIYDCYYLALAKQENATSILTTDTDFDKLCKRIGLNYENPVPLDILKKFSAFK
ncbi:MAG: type II toxin-antitoxin system VapC family toxin [Candidatus Lokiarchaeota archaeon]|nr:type II toxin-antitoxin system VapC family toxin [Candidatus Lokiarchaeota archaeon]